jgi:hypothetical protein
MAIDPFGRFVYTAGEYDIALVTDRIAENGTLTKLTDFFQDDGYQFWNTIAADPLGRFVYHFSAPDDSFLAATLSVYRVGTNGLTLGASYQTGFLAYSMIVDLSGQFLFLGGISVGYGVSTYRVGANGSLTPLTSLPLGFAPTAMAVSSSW